MFNRKKVNVLCRTVAAVVASISMMLGCVVPSFAQVPGNTPDEQIYNFMKNECGVKNDAAIAGIIAVIEQDSEFNPQMVACDGDTGADRIGLCLWTGNRLNNLKAFCKKNNYDWQSFEGQLRFIKYEWETSFKNVNRAMHNTPIDQDYNFPDSEAGAQSFGDYLVCQYVLTGFAENDEGKRAKEYYPRVKQIAQASSANAATTNASTQAPAVTNSAAPAPAAQAAPAPAAQAASAPGQSQESTEQHIYNFLVNNAGIKNKAAIAGIMATMEFDTGYNPNAVNNQDGVERYGLCSWSGDRLKGLKVYCKKNKLDYQSVDGQLNYMVYEWNTYFKNIERVMHNNVKDQDYNFADSAEGADQFATFFVLQYTKFSNMINNEFAGDRARNVTYQKVVNGFTAK